VAVVGTLSIVLQGSVTDFERAMGRAARAVKNTEKEFMRSARNMERIGWRWTKGITAPILAGMALVGKAAIEWEDAFAGVRKTVDATEEQFAELEQTLSRMAEKIPLTHREIAQIAETAGQLGIQVENIAEFTEVMAMLGTATNMASEEAAMALAQMANVMQSGQRNFDRLGATVVHLGNNLATTESKIVHFAQRLAGQGKIAGLAEAHVLAIAGAFASVGIEAEAGGTAVGKVLQSMTEAVATGNQNLRVFSAVAGMAVDDFATLWRQDAAEAFTRFVEGLGRSGDKAFAIMRALGLTDARLMRGFLSVANAGDLLRRSIAMGTQAWEENTALVKEAQERYKTIASRIRIIQNRIYNLRKELGQGLRPVFDAILTRAERLIIILQRAATTFNAWPEPLRKAVGSLLIMVAVVGPVILAFAGLAHVLGAIAGAVNMLTALVGKVVFAFATWKAGAATLGEALVFVLGGKIGVIVLAIGALIMAGIWLMAHWDQVKSVAIRVWNAIAAAILYAESVVIKAIGGWLTALSWIVPPLRSAAEKVVQFGDQLRATAQKCWEVASSVVEAAEGAKDIADTGEEAADSQKELSDALAEAANMAGKGIQAFDEVHQIQDDLAGLDWDLPGFEFPSLIKPPTVDELDLGGTVGQGLEDLGNRITDLGNKVGAAFAVIGEKMAAVKAMADGIGSALDNIAALGLTIALIWQFKPVQSLTTALWGFLQGVIPPLFLSPPYALAAGILAAAVYLVWRFELFQKLQDAFGYWRATQNIPAELPAGILYARFAVEWVFSKVRDFADAVGKWIEGLGLPKELAYLTPLGVIFGISWGFQPIRELMDVLIEWIDGLQLPGGLALLSPLVLLLGIQWRFTLIQRLADALSEWWAEHKPSTEELVQLADKLGAAFEPLVLYVPLLPALRALRTWAEALTEWYSLHGLKLTDVSAFAETLGAVPIFAPVRLGMKAVNTWLEALRNWWAEHAPSVEDLQVWLDALAPLGLLAGVTLGFKLVWDKLADSFTTWWEAAKPTVALSIQKLVTDLALIAGVALGFSMLWDHLKSEFPSWWQSIQQRVTDTLQALVPTITLDLPISLNPIPGALKRIQEIFEDAGVKLKAGWDRTLSELAQKWAEAKVSIGEKVAGLAKEIQQHFSRMGTEVPLAAATMVSSLLLTFGNLFYVLVGGSIVPDLVTKILWWFDQLKQGVITVKEFTVGVEAVLADFQARSTQSTFEWCNTVKDLVSGLAASMKYSLSNTFDQLLSGAITFGEAFKSIFSNILDAVRRKIADFLAEKAVSALIGLLTGGATWAAGGGGFLGGIIGGVTKGISGIVKGIGSIFGLASGGIVTAPTLALVGEGHRREAVIPLERDNVIAESVGAAVFDAMMTAHRFQQASGPGPAGDDREIVFKIDGATFARLILPHLVREGQRQGMDVVIRPALEV